MQYLKEVLIDASIFDFYQSNRLKARIIGDNISLITFFNGKSLSVLHLWLFDENIFRISGNTSLSSFALNQAPFEPNTLQPQDVHDKLHSAVNSHPPRCALY